MESNFYIPERIEEIGQVVLFHRKKSGLSRAELSSLSGVGQSSIYDLEKGKTTISMEILFKILKVLNIKVAVKSPLMNVYIKENIKEENKAEDSKS